MYKWGGPRPYPAFVLFCLNKKARFAVVAGVAPHLGSAVLSSAWMKKRTQTTPQWRGGSGDVAGHGIDECCRRNGRPELFGVDYRDVCCGKTALQECRHPGNVLVVGHRVDSSPDYYQQVVIQDFA